TLMSDNGIAKLLAAVALAGVLASCSESARLPQDASVGPNPVLPQPVKTMIPTLNIAPARGWGEDQTPRPAVGLNVNVFADGLVHPRWLYTLPNGDVLVAETNAPDRPEEGTGAYGFVMKDVMARAGDRVKSPDRITLLRDADGDGIAE